MNTQASALPQPSVPGQPAAPAPISAARRLYWSVRRELWEHSSIYIAPLITAAVMLCGFAINSIGLPRRRRAVLLLDPLQQRIHIEKAYDVAIGMLLLTALLVWLFYCLDALYGERRDRSILFWKSLPVSDLATVLSKAMIPFVALPLLVFGITVVTHTGMLLIGNAFLLVNGLAPTTSSQLPLPHVWLTLLYGLAAMTLWNAPIYGWLLLVSAWARRAPLLWATLPHLALVAIEKVAFQTSFFASLLTYRAMGWTTEAFALRPRGGLLIDPLNPIAPQKFLASSGLWIRLASAALFLGVAVRLRRYRGPI